MIITVVGLGYVGLPLAMMLCEGGHHVTGYDIDSEKVKSIREGREQSGVSAEEIKKWLEEGLFDASDGEIGIYRPTDIFFICVPTPYTAARQPDLSCIESAAKSIGSVISKNSMVVLQSTSYPGTTMDVMVPIIEEHSGLIYENGDFDVAFLPERINPGSGINLKDIPKVVGVNRDTEWKRICWIFASSGVKLLRMTSPAAAEMTKLLENTFRAVNIGFVNEMARLCERMNLNIWEIVDAAATKPYGYMPFYPGPGVGGHCIPIDPYYLLHKALEHNKHLRIVEDAMESNELMPEHVVDIVNMAARQREITAYTNNTIWIGATYKPDVADTRESPLSNIEPDNTLWNTWDAVLDKDISLTEVIFGYYDIAVILINHSGVDYQYIIDNVKLVVDCCGATRGLDEKGKVYLLGRGFGG